MQSQGCQHWSLGILSLENQCSQISEDRALWGCGETEGVVWVGQGQGLWGAYSWDLFIDPELLSAPLGSPLNLHILPNPHFCPHHALRLSPVLATPPWLPLDMWLGSPVYTVTQLPAFLSSGCATPTNPLCHSSYPVLNRLLGMGKCHSWGNLRAASPVGNWWEEGARVFIPSYTLGQGQQESTESPSSHFLASFSAG